MQELADELKVSKVTVFEHVEALIKKGALRREPNKARSLELSEDVQLPDEERSTRIPLVGMIAAGNPIEAVESRETLDLESLFGARSNAKFAATSFQDADPDNASSSVQLPSGAVFALQVRGDSMIEDHICDGDYVVVQRQATARNGQTVVALLDSGEATLKRYYKEKDHIRLQPANVNYEPILVPNCIIQGIVIGVIRTC
jgi:repressor LexA